MASTSVTALMPGRDGGVTKGHIGNFGSIDHVPCFYCGDSFMCESMPQFIKLYTLNVSSFL